MPSLPRWRGVWGIRRLATWDSVHESCNGTGSRGDFTGTATASRREALAYPSIRETVVRVDTAVAGCF